MWIMLDRAFLSIVHKPPCGPNELLVRARRKEDIARVFHKPKVTRSTDSDYLYRAVIDKDEVIEAISHEIGGIDYDNFKDNVEDPILHEAYVKVWSAMAEIQPLPPYSGMKNQRRKT